jgi:uncharacterized protein (TIGR01777 family)
MENQKDFILIAGGSGLIGNRLKKVFLENGYRVGILTRTPKEKDQFQWDPKLGTIDKEILGDVTILINLSGAGIADKRWTKDRKEELYTSRIGTNKFLHAHCQHMPKLKQFITASGINCYGYDDPKRKHIESDPFGQDFLSDLVRKWEESADLFDGKYIVSKIRTSVVLDEKGGALKKMMSPIQWGIGSALGTGKQNMPWIHADDLAYIYLHVVSHKLGGAYNALAGSVTNEFFTKTLASTLHKPYFFPKIPSIAMKLIFGDMASVLLEGLQASNQKIKDTGFLFKYEKLENALTQLLTSKTN